MFTKDEYLTAPQAAAIKGVTRSAVYKAVQEGRLPATLLVGVIALRRKDIDEWEVGAREGRRPRSKASPETKAKIADSQRRRWQARKERRD